jgi:predicted kinase
MRKLHIMVGNVGCGKSTRAHKLAERSGAVVICMDEIQKMVAGGDYGAYDPNKRDLYQTIEETAFTKSMVMGLDIVIDRTNMDRRTREKWIAMARSGGYHVCIHDFGSGTEEHLKRRQDDPRGVMPETWQGVFDAMKAKYERPENAEGAELIVRLR